jgi:acyl-coenzyme A thioesterase PaaI-like protein
MTINSSYAEVPEGFVPIFRTSPFLDTLGPFFYRPLEPGFIIGLRVGEKHGNARGTAHGGLLLTLADIPLGYTAAASSDPPLKLTTVNISADFAGHILAIGSKLKSMFRELGIASYSQMHSSWLKGNGSQE